MNNPQGKPEKIGGNGNVAVQEAFTNFMDSKDHKWGNVGKVKRERNLMNTITHEMFRPGLEMKGYGKFNGEWDERGVEELHALRICQFEKRKPAKYQLYCNSWD